ncbi:alpha-galactosidase C precursor [Aspergillus terreus NIH2624]|uniref:Probable alpha-galactosidase G n=1 Tax=Aspergillus terreus (strain NIH 2624 / FGSC A1156) TaxID=341663 RepID=AGALG_ASPTN|nr:alpha-galactosidase C precursor [Aspergillus terreus NIH2624]Q0CEF5.1 RecName: Full=Probable alpha-galactosidase G; AltName: Full=Melibiase G [Aspergillus terreus NIH2624]EAU32191.1 alpha-galactosidase C precursor [Aspergillus terreus NIH2624]
MTIENGIAKAIYVDGTKFVLNGRHVSYCFHVDDETGDLRTDHFGGRVTGAIPVDPSPVVDGWTGMPDRVRREFPDQGRGDFRIPALRIRQAEGHTVSALKYQSYTLLHGKPDLPGLPATFGTEKDVSTLVVHLRDEYSSVTADLIYSVFPEYNAIVRSVSITNNGFQPISIEALASFSTDLPYEDLEMISLRGDWAREAHRMRRKVEYGTQGFGSTTGFSSHLHNPFLALAHPSTTESQGEAWGFSLVYTGSFEVNVEKGSQGLTRAVLGFHPNQLSWPLSPGETLTSPECVAVYSNHGLGGMSRSLHRLFRDHLIKSKFATANRPVLLNSWEGLYFDIDETSMIRIAKESAALGVKLLVMDDGWFGKDYPRTSDAAGLGDWVPNPARFPNGLAPMVDQITSLKVANSSANLLFGIWVEPEMVNPDSALYREHPEWALHAGSYPRTEQRNQLVLNLALLEVQEFIINFMTDLLSSAKISYVKWDLNRGINETSAPKATHAYMLGMYKVFDTLTSRFPDVLWEGCAAGGGRFDPGILQYFPQIWTSDDSDAVERIFIQMGSSLAYPASAMGAHISAVPNHQTGRTTPLSLRAHVAMMGGSFGLELDPSQVSAEEKALIPELIALAEKVNPIVLTGDMWRLSLPEESNWPAVQFISQDQSQVVLFYFQLSPNVNHSMPRVRLQGLDEDAMYRVDGAGPYSGAMLMNLGLQYSFRTEYGSRVVFLEKQ